MMRVYRNDIEKIVIFTSTENFKELYFFLKDRGNACSVVIPENRLGTEKVEKIQKFCVTNSVDFTVHPRAENELEAFHLWIAQRSTGLALSWNYSQILKEKTLEIFPRGVWNMHGGKIPEYRGNHVLQWAIVNGEQEAGVTWHVMDKIIDHGLILKQGTVPIHENDTTIELSQKVCKKGLELFSELWDEAGKNGVQTYSVNMDAGRYWKSRTPLDGIIYPDMTKKEINNLLRAQCPPWPAPVLVTSEKVFRVHGIATEYGEGTVVYHGKDADLLLKTTEENDSDFVKKIREGIRNQ